jgi:hypothetical protein
MRDVSTTSKTSIIHRLGSPFQLSNITTTSAVQSACYTRSIYGLVLPRQRLFPTDHVLLGYRIFRSLAAARPWPRSRDHLTNGTRHVTICSGLVPSLTKVLCIEVKRKTTLLNSATSPSCDFTSFTAKQTN